MPLDLAELRQRIEHAVAGIGHQMLVHVWQELDYRIIVCRVTIGGHMEYLYRNFERYSILSHKSFLHVCHGYRSAYSRNPQRDFALYIIYHHHHHHHQYFLPKGRSCTACAWIKVAVLPKAGLPLQTQEPRLQFYQGWIGVVASRCFQHPTLSFASEQTLKDVKRSQGHQRGGEESGFG